MTVFKTFEINYNNIKIDDIIIEKPNYLSSTQWYEFWSFVEEANLGDSVDDKVESEVDAILSQTEYDHEIELKDSLNKQASEINERLEGLINLIRGHMNDIEDDIITTKINET